MYVLTKTDTDDTGQTFLHAFDITTGQEKPGSPVQVAASAPGTGDGSVNGVVSFDGPASSGRFHANDRPGLLLLNGVVYAAFAHNSDSFPYHGWILGYQYDGTQFTQTAEFCTTPNGGDGGIWMAGKGLTADAAGYIYCSVGNGTFDADTKGITAGTDYGMCYLKLRASDLTVVDWFAPYDEQGLSNADLDLGNSGRGGHPRHDPAVRRGRPSSGRASCWTRANLGRFTPERPGQSPAASGRPDRQRLRGPEPHRLGRRRPQVRLPVGERLEPGAVPLRPRRRHVQPRGRLQAERRPDGGGSLAVTSAGGSGGILWAVGGDNIVHAFDATDVSKPQLWNSALNSTRDGLGSVGHFQFPTVVNGKVYVPTGAASIAVYGLIPLALSSLTVPSPAAGGTVVTATVTLNFITPTDAVIGLSSSDSSVVRVHRAVVIPAGSSSVTFPITTYHNPATKTVTIQATLSSVVLTKTLIITGG